MENEDKGRTMNNEPVAWLIQYKDRHKFVFEKPTYSEHILACEPLYTHPAQKPMMVLDGNRVYPAFKELTDEEIGQIWKDCMESPYMQISNPVGFARAILRKAQENG